MNIAFIIVCVLVVISNIAIIALILAQQKNASSGFGAAMSGMGGGGGDSYWSANKGRSMEGQLAKYTKIFAAAFFILVLVSNFIK